jgi:DNA-directed RNA polymerase specialized sigma24 family protein
VSAVISPSVLPPALHLIGQLAMEHAAHVKWLQGRFPGCASGVLEDALQTAYAEALQQLREPSDRRPEFGSYDAARGWLRTIAANTARRTLRRVAEVPLTGDEGWETDAAPAADSELLDRAEREHVHDELQRALAELTDEHARFLRWRYVENLSPATIMSLEDFSTVGQYDGRHRRALDALRNALVRLQPDRGCGEARVLLLRQPDAFIAAKRAAAHVAGCVPCQAYQRRLRGALAAMPLSPASLRALSDAVRRHPGRPETEPGDAPRPATEPSASALPAHVSRFSAGVAKAVAIAGAAVLCVGGIAIFGGDDSGDARPAAAAKVNERTTSPSSSTPSRTLRWSDHRRSGSAFGEP